VILRTHQTAEKRRSRIQFRDFLYTVMHKRFRFPLRILNDLEASVWRDPRDYEPKVSEFLLRTRGEVFVDIGANTGIYPIFLSKNYEQIVAVEPDPRNTEYMRRNLRRAKVKNVTIAQVAISDEDGCAILHFAEQIGCHSLCTNFQQGGTRVQTLTLASLYYRLPSILFPHGDFVPMDLVKIDVEGVEFQVLMGVESIYKKIRKWVVELHDLHRKKELEKWFLEHSYGVKWLDENHIFAYQKA